MKLQKPEPVSAPQATQQEQKSISAEHRADFSDTL